ncbi:MAG: hypothetical protein Q9211_000099 [Gyalolechia sp. 1 TL-2023]
MGTVRFKAKKEERDREGGREGKACGARYLRKGKLIQERPTGREVIEKMTEAAKKARRFLLLGIRSGDSGPRATSSWTAGTVA